jgi:hypothetical protein
MFLLLLAVFGLAHGKNILLVPGPGSPFSHGIKIKYQLVNLEMRIMLSQEYN